MTTATMMMTMVPFSRHLVAYLSELLLLTLPSRHAHGYQLCASAASVAFAVGLLATAAGFGARLFWRPKSWWEHRNEQQHSS
jgi:hypothetical protein